MPYKITVTKIEKLTVTRRGEWRVIDKRPYTQEEVTQFCAGADSTEIKEVMGYTPDREVVEENEIEMLSQVVEDLDFTEVVKAVNQIK